MSKDWVADVTAFHEKCNLPVPDVPQFPGAAREFLRGKLATEEWKELWMAWRTEDLPGIADAIADLIYVLIGMALEYGIPLNDVWDEVQRANMTKEPVHNADGKVVKPAGFVPPDIAGILKKHGASL